MQCPHCGSALAPATRDGIEMLACPTCEGMWLTPPELNALEDRAFDLGDEEKGTLVFRTEPSERKCPQCGKPMRTFDYRLYDLQLDVCEDAHGYWLDAGEDKKLLDWMKEEEARLKRSGKAEKGWKSLVAHLHSTSFVEKLRDLFS